jgi:hypothetical protein
MMRLEFLDEYEEWQLFNHHYCIACASRGERLAAVTFAAQAP